MKTEIEKFESVKKTMALAEYEKCNGQKIVVLHGSVAQWFGASFLRRP